MTLNRRLCNHSRWVVVVTAENVGSTYVCFMCCSSFLRRPHNYFEFFETFLGYYIPSLNYNIIKGLWLEYCKTILCGMENVFKQLFMLLVMALL